MDCCSDKFHSDEGSSHSYSDSNSYNGMVQNTCSRVITADFPHRKEDMRIIHSILTFNEVELIICC